MGEQKAKMERPTKSSHAPRRQQTLGGESEAGEPIELGENHRIDPSAARRIKGRGAVETPPNRFEPLHFEPSADENDPEAPGPDTLFYRDASRKILAENASPDIDFRWSLNPYRGCEHGCVYCYARPSHEYLGFNAGLDFESRIMVKDAAPQLLERTFRSRRWKPDVIALSGNTDCYQPAERRLEITRRCLRVFATFRNPVAVITKSALVARDADLLGELAGHSAAQVRVSITTLDPTLARRLEPRAAAPHRRLEAIRRLREAGVPTGVMVAPVIPGLNDVEIPRIVEAAAAAGAQTASWILVRLAPPLDDLLLRWVDRHYPERRKRIENRIRETRAGEMTDSRFGRRMRGQGEYASQLDTLFKTSARRHGLDGKLPPLTTEAFRLPPERGQQLSLAI